MSEKLSEIRKRGLPSTSVLQGHDRNRKKLIPPILGVGNTQLISTLDSILPEIVWAGIIIDKFGVRDGVQVLSNFLTSLWDIDGSKNWYRFSELISHPHVVSQIEKPVRDDVAIAFSTFRDVYQIPNLEWATVVEDLSVSRDRIIKTIEKYSNRFEQPYLLIVSTIIYSMALAEKMCFAPGTFPDIEAIADDWGTDKAELASCSVRACSMAFFPHDGSASSESWCKNFWRTNYQISGCR